MGQSFDIVNVAKKVFVSPHDWGHGYKLPEFSRSFDTLAVLYKLLSTDGETGGWKNSRVAFIGDESSFWQKNDIEDFRPMAHSHFQSIAKKGLKRLNASDYVPGRQIDRSSLPERIAFVNHSKHRFIEIDSRSADEFTVGALVSFLLDVSSANADDMYYVHEGNENATPDPILEFGGDVFAVHAGSWAHDAIEAMPSSLATSGFVPMTRWFRDVATELRSRKARSEASHKALRKRQKIMMNDIDDITIDDSSDDDAQETP